MVNDTFPQPLYRTGKFQGDFLESFFFFKRRILHNEPKELSSIAAHYGKFGLESKMKLRLQFYEWQEVD